MKKLIFIGLTLLSFVTISISEAGFYDDKDFDGLDLAAFVAAFGTLVGSPNYDPDADFAADGDVDLIDLKAFTTHFGGTDCEAPEAVGEIGATGGIVEVTDPSSLIYRAAIEIPPMALKEVELITISLMAPPAALPADGSFAAGECVHFGPEGLLFGSYVDLYLPYFDDNGDGLLDGTNSIELEVGVKHFNRSAGNWDTVEVVGRQADLNLVHIASNHLSPYMPYGNCNGLPLQADQVNDVAPKLGVGCGTPPVGMGSIFQSFTPSASVLAAMDLRLKAGGEFPSLGYETTVNVRSDSPSGPLLGTATVQVPGPQTVGTQLEVRFDFSPVIPLSPGNPYLIEWISPLEGDWILTWMTADRDAYPGGTAFSCTGTAIPNDDLIFKTYSVEPLPAEKETAYFELMTDPKIDAATNLTEGEQAILIHFIRQLEYQATCDWEDLHRPEVSSLSIEELKMVWLRRLAVALYHEVNDRFPWKIVDYSQNDLDVLLGFNFLNGNPSFLDPANSGGDFANIASDRYYFRNVVWSANPLHAMVIMHIVRDLYIPPTPQQAASKFVDYLRELWWYHGNQSDPAWEELPYHVSTTPEGISVRVWNFEAYFMINQGGGCSSASGVVREAMRAFNIPAIVGTNVYDHQGVYLPSLDLIMIHGDDIYSYIFRYYPAQDTFRTRQWYEPFIGQDLCDFYFAHRKKAYLDWFSYYQDPVYGPKLEYQFCNSYKAQTGFFYSDMTEPFSSSSTQCSWILGEDPEVQQGLLILDAYFDCGD